MTDERRKDYPDILEKLNDLETSYAVLKAMQNKDLETSMARHQEFLSKLDKITEWLDNAPCKERYAECSNQILSLSKNQNRLWWAIGLMMVFFVGLVLVDIKQIVEMSKDINDIKSYSYGYQEYIHGKKMSPVRE